MNALAATAATLAMGIELPVIAAGLSTVEPVRGRWQAQPGLSGCQLIDDTYNANPASLKAGLELLANAAGDTWLVLGDMGELGNDSARLHRDVARAVKKAGVDRLFATGELCRDAVITFGEDGQWFETVDGVIDALRKSVTADVNILVQGSRFMHMERVVEALAIRDTGEER